MPVPDTIEVECEFQTAGVLKATLESALANHDGQLRFSFRKHREPTPKRQVVLVAHLDRSTNNLARLLRACLQLLQQRKPAAKGRVLLRDDRQTLVELTAENPPSQADQAAATAGSELARIEIPIW